MSSKLNLISTPCQNSINRLPPELLVEVLHENYDLEDPNLSTTLPFPKLRTLRLWQDAFSDPRSHRSHASRLDAIRKLKNTPKLRKDAGLRRLDDLSLYDLTGFEETDFPGLGQYATQVVKLVWRSW